MSLFNYALCTFAQRLIVKIMKSIKILLVVLFTVISGIVSAQTMTITNPVLTSPYQVVSGTVVTFKFSAFSTAPNGIFTSTTAPTVQQNLMPDASWTWLTNWTGPDANGDYSINITVNSDIWVLGGINGWIGWQYSNVVAVQVVSPLVITASDSMICPTAGNVIFTAPTGTGYSFQWYSGGTAIIGATSSTYTATTAGIYHCDINNGTSNITNSITISNYQASFTGAYNSNQMTLTTDQTFASYQWFERIGTGTPIAITGATSNQYVATVSTSAKYYSFQGTTTSGCAVSSVERMVIDTLFTTPVIVINTTTNSQGNICFGTPTSLVSTGNNGFHQWVLNGSNTYSGVDSLNLNGSNQNGSWNVDVYPADWPEVAIASNSIAVNFVNLITPSISGANYNSSFCTGDVIPMILTDEGYTYTWYVHDTINVYNNSHIISVPTGVYQHPFAGEKYVTIEATFNGCTKIRVIHLQGWSSQGIYLSIDNYNQQYLCVDSTINILFPSSQVSDYQNFQWYENVSGNWTVLANDTNANLNVDDPGEYRVLATSVVCPSVTNTSISKVIHSYLDREPSIYTWQNTMCEGDTVLLQLSGGSNWNAKQWMEADIVIGSTGYYRVYQGMLTNTASDTQNVDKYGSYQVSAKHYSCPNGLKVKSNILFITPTVNPVIDMITPLSVVQKHVLTWDSAAHVIGCDGEPVAFTLNNLEYDTVMWYHQLYSGQYAPGTYLSSLDTISNYPLPAEYITAVVIDSNGCKGQSTPLLLDTRVFSSPAVTSYGNNQLCEPGDSVLMHSAFPGTWIAYKWYLDGVEIPGETNDSIWGKVPGEYIIAGFPADCPTFEYNSGLGPVVSFMTAEIIEYQDTLIYAFPFQGYYSFQWFFNGDSIDAPDSTLPHVFAFQFMQPGTYTAAITNDAGCTKLTDPYVRNPNGIKDVFVDDLARIYPNPTNGLLTIETAKLNNISAITLIDVKGDVVYRTSGLSSNIIDVSGLSNGVYILRIDSRDGHIQRIKLFKQ
jgi:hypothetical protein